MLLLPQGLFLGLLLSQWQPRSDVPVERAVRGLGGKAGPVRAISFASWLLSSPQRESLWPVLSLSIGVWLPALLCIHRESPDWSLAYLLPPERATPALLAAIFTVTALAIPAGFALGLLLRYRLVRLSMSPLGSALRLRALRAAPLLLLLLLLFGMLGVARLGAERLWWLGSHADFHDGRWLLLPLWGGGPLALRIASVLGVSLFAVGAGVGVTIRALRSIRDTAARKRADEDGLGLGTSIAVKPE